MKFRTLLLLAAALPQVVAAQSLAVAKEPVWFTTLGVGLQFGGVFVVDDASESTWDFDAGVAWRGTLERNVARDVAVGLAWQYARLPLSYKSLSQSGPCASACGADATIGYVGVVGRYGGGGLGFQRLFELSIGGVRYGSFEDVNGSGRLRPNEGNTDFAFGVAAGFGYGISPDWQVMIVQESLNAIHERSKTPLGAGRITRQNSTRVGVRIGW